MGFPPPWYLILEAAHNDPLRAQEMEEKLSQEWWDRWRANREAKNKADEKEARAAQLGKTNG